MTARHKYSKKFRLIAWFHTLLFLCALTISSAPLEKDQNTNQTDDKKQPGKHQLSQTEQIHIELEPPVVIIDTNSATAGPNPLQLMPGVADFRISEMGGIGIADYNQALNPAIAYNPVTFHYLTVWSGDDDTGSKDEIYGRFIDAASGVVSGPDDIRIAEMIGDDNNDAINPDVVYNSTLNEFLVVWQGVHRDSSLTTEGNHAQEIFARRIAADGTLLDLSGSAASATSGILRVSNMGTDDNNGNFNAYNPAVAYDAENNGFLIVWNGDDDGSGLSDGEYEIFGQLLGITGGTLSLSGSVMLVSDMDDNNDGEDAAVIYNDTNDEWLVAWEGRNKSSNGSEIYGQRLTAAGTEINDPANNFQISNTPTPGDEARNVSLTWNTNDNQYLVVWCGEGSGLANKFNVFGIILNNDASAPGVEFPISNMGPDNETNYRAFAPQVDYSSIDNEYFVVWSGDDNRLTLVDGEYEIFGQRINALGAEIGPGDFRISDMGPDGNILYGAQQPSLVYNSSGANSYMIVWSGDDDTETIDDELEIFGRMVGPHADLSIAKTDGITSVVAGAAVTYTLTAFNNGPDDVTGVIVSDYFSSDLHSITWAAVETGGATGFQSAGAGVIADSGIGLPNGAMITYTVNAVVDSSLAQGAFLTNTATVVSLLALDPDLTNNSATDDDTEVQRIADLMITKSDSVLEVGAGKSLTYSITITNMGPVHVHHTSVLDSFPEELNNISWTASGSSGTSGFDNAGTGSIFDDDITVPVGGSVTYIAEAWVDSAVASETILVNTAIVADSVATDPDLANNSATDDNTVVLTDVDPPIITLAEPKIIWWPNYMYTKIKLSDCVISVVDSVDGPIAVANVVIDSVSSDEPENIPEDWEKKLEEWLRFLRGLLEDWKDDKDNGNSKLAKKAGGGDNEIYCYKGDGYTFNDIVIGPDCRSVKLRRERWGGGNGRVYKIHMSVSDEAGNVGTAVYLVNVPLNCKQPDAIDDGPVYTVVADCAEELEQPPLTKITAPDIPDKFSLLQNYPNPFNPETEIRFELPEVSNVVITIYNMLGQKIQTLTNQTYEAGYHSVMWNGKDVRGASVASGVYIYEIRANEFVMHKKMVMTR